MHLSNSTQILFSLWNYLLEAIGSAFETHVLAVEVCIRQVDDQLFEISCHRQIGRDLREDFTQLRERDRLNVESEV